MAQTRRILRRLYVAVEIDIRERYSERVARTEHSAEVEPGFDRPWHRAAIVFGNADATEPDQAFVDGVIDHEVSFEVQLYGDISLETALGSNGSP